MSNFNMSFIKTIVNNLDLECQLIAGANPRTCKYIIIQGKQLKTSNWTKAEAEAVLLTYKEENCKKSEIEDIFNIETDNRGNIKDLIDFEHETLTSCLEKLRSFTEASDLNKVKSWVETMTDLHRNEISNRVDINKCAKKIKNMFDNKEVVILNGFIYSTYELKNIVEIWQKIHEVKGINIDAVVEKYIKAVEKLYC